MSAKKAPKPNASNKIEITRIYDAPVKLVWEAWTDPAQVAKWWGPRGFSITTHSKDLKPGGHWNYTMHGPDGTDYPNSTKYFEVEKYSRLVYDHGGYADKPPLFRVEVNFTDLKGKTKMEMSMILDTPEKAAEIRKFIKQASGNSTWDRLAEYLEKESSGKEKFVINRSFDAPVDVMFDMWTNPDHLMKWLAPTGTNMNFIRADIKPGGSSFYCMSGENGGQKFKMYGRIHYKKIERPGLIEYTQEFTDEKENISRHPFAPTWPASMRTEIKLADEGNGQTRVTVTWETDGPVTSEELATFVKERGGMTQGWTGSFDKLEAYLENGN